MSVTVPVYINTEVLTKWRTDLQNKTEFYWRKIDGQDMHPLGNVIVHDSLPPALLPQWTTQHGLFGAQNMVTVIESGRPTRQKSAPVWV